MIGCLALIGAIQLDAVAVLTSDCPLPLLFLSPGFIIAAISWSHILEEIFREMLAGVIGWIRSDYLFYCNSLVRCLVWLWVGSFGAKVLASQKSVLGFTVNIQKHVLAI